MLAVSGLAAGALQVLGPAAGDRGGAPARSAARPSRSRGTFRAAALFAAPLAVAGLVVALPLAAAVALVGVAMTAPALVLRRGAGAPQAAR